MRPTNRDYSSSFFAGLSGRDRVGEAVASADYDQNGQVSFAEAHAFAKVDAATPDWPISTSEAWLQQQIPSPSAVAAILEHPLQRWVAQARPEQRHVITALAAKLGYDLQTPLTEMTPPRARFPWQDATVLAAYDQRLRMQVVAVGMEAQIRAQAEAEAIAVLEKLLTCEAGHWSQGSPGQFPAERFPRATVPVP